MAGAVKDSVEVASPLQHELNAALLPEILKDMLLSASGQRFPSLSTILMVTNARSGVSQIPFPSSYIGVEAKDALSVTSSIWCGFADKTNIQFHLADDPLKAVARGTCDALKHTDEYKFLMK